MLSTFVKKYVNIYIVPTNWCYRSTQLPLYNIYSQVFIYPEIFIRVTNQCVGAVIYLLNKRNKCFYYSLEIEIV